ncbi:MAG TPA: TlpA disulfide reductase family protein [Pyrinomonadaceae bacterium]|nr:TlpA disulfide reductase family protein [Pyrinomonadaceae bacterium]
MKLTRILRLSGLLVVLCGLLPISAGSRAETKDEFSIKLKGIDGKTYDVAKMRGEVVLVSFGATWCKPCAAELEALEGLKQEYAGRAVKFLWVSIESDDQTSNELLRDYAKSLKMTIPVLRDPEKTAFAQFSERVRLPMVVFFDREGNFVAPKHTGMTSQAEDYKKVIRARLDALLRAQEKAGASGSLRQTSQPSPPEQRNERLR